MARTQIDGFTAELDESKAKLMALKEKLDELESKKKGCQGRIALAKSKCDQYTRSDVLRFKGESQRFIFSSWSTTLLWCAAISTRQVTKRMELMDRGVRVASGVTPLARHCNDARQDRAGPRWIGPVDRSVHPSPPRLGV